MYTLKLVYRHEQFSSNVQFKDVRVHVFLVHAVCVVRGHGQARKGE